jgi:hypothetical protein
VCSNAARLFLVWRFVGIQPFDRRYVRLAVPAAAGAAVMMIAHIALRDQAWSVDLIGSALLGTAAYLAVLVAAGLTPGEKAALGSLVRARRTGSTGTPSPP